MRKLLVLPALLLGLLTLPVSTAEAVTYGFDCVSNNGQCAVLEAQMQLDVTDGTGDTVDFLFSNLGPISSFITDIWFYDVTPLFDWTLYDNSDITDSGAGVLLTTGCNPNNPTGAVGWNTTPGGACADPGSAPDGVGVGEWVNINLTLLAGLTFDDVIAAIDGNVGDLRIALHLQGLPDGISETGVIDGGPGDGGDIDELVAEPATLLLLGSGLVAVGARFRRRRENA